jgi:ABC-type bacteriocin/lantibiotic exporter with double-glycine peptidase domain
MEFLEMQDNRQALYGEDILEHLNVSTEHLRLECEQQLKGKLMRLRQTFLEVGIRTNVITESINSLLPIFRTLHRLRGIPVPAKKGQLIASLSGIGVDTEVFLLALDIKRGKYKLKRKELEPFLTNYIAEIEKLCEWIDRFRGKLTTVSKKK